MKRYILMIMISGLLMISCNKFGDMNKNPQSPTGTEIGPLFNGVVASLTYNGNEMFYLDNEIFYPETELGALTSDAWGNFQIGTQAVWDNYYYALGNIRDIEQRFEERCKDDPEICDKVKAQLIVLKAFKTFKVTDYFGDIPYSEAGKIWYNTTETSNKKPKFDSQESIYKSLLNELVWAREILLGNKAQTDLGNEFFTLGVYDVLYANNYEKWAKIANSLILKHGLRMYDKDIQFADTLLKTAFNKPVIDDYWCGSGGFMLWPMTLTNPVGDVNWSFREHRNLRMGETVFAQMSDSDDPTGAGIFDLRMYIFFDTNHKTDEFPQGAWKGFPQMKDASTPTEGGTPYERTRDQNYAFKGPSCLYSPFNYYLIRDNSDQAGFIPRILMSAAEVCFIKAEIAFRGIVSVSQMESEQLIVSGITNSYYIWLQLHSNATVQYNPAWKYTYPALADALQAGDFYSVASSYASQILNHIIYMNPEFDYTQEAYIKAIHQQRWLDLFRQPGEAWCLARRGMDTPTTTDHQKLTYYRLPYPPTEVTYNYDNYNQQVGKMSNGDTKYTKVWWME
ncbi:MAG: SusD/RagB family nutrient-binding outer membrane lipoprotein [Bacteroidales bacterium]|nr:SusD/RagB family nutrient-binding outer membrane lipoprotein [Bacteroidales bacterium]